MAGKLNRGKTFNQKRALHLGAYSFVNQYTYHKISLKIKKLCCTSRAFDTLDTLNLTGAKATGANIYGSVSAVYFSFNSTNVGLPGSVGLAVRVRNVMSKGNALAADTALSHFDTSKNPALSSVILYKFI